MSLLNPDPDLLVSDTDPDPRIWLRIKIQLRIQILLRIQIIKQK
jgi:hypothetical protein